MASFDAIQTLPDGQCGGNGFPFSSSCGKTKEKDEEGETPVARRKDAGDAFQHSSRRTTHTQGK